jgi:hypothetical protein
MNCEEIRSDLTLYYYGELESEQEELVEQHLADCAGCRAELTQLQNLLTQVDTAASEPSAELLAQCRAGLSAAMQPEARPAWRRFLESLRPPAWVSQWVAQPAMAAALLGLGFFGGKVFEQNRFVSSHTEEVARVRAIHGQGDGTVRIVVDEPRERVVSGGLQDENIQRLLLAATRQSADPGLRLESVDLLRNRVNRDDVRQVFLQTLAKDADPGVRLRTLEALRPFTQEQDVRRAISSVLLGDANPNVRVLAIDVLVDGHPSEMVGTLQQVIRQEDNEYVRSRCLRALGAMRASPGTF